MSSATAHSDLPSREELLRRARELVPVLFERAQATEENRSVLPETVAAFERAGFYRILQPAIHGGYEMHPLVLFEAVRILARACPSSAWCLGVVGIHNWELPLLGSEACRDVWGASDTRRMASAHAPVGRVEIVEGGYMLSGRWSWASGCDQSEWMLLGGFVRAEGQPPDRRAFLVPKADYEIVDNWHVLGLKGTGSKDIAIASAFVPEHRTLRFADAYAKQEPGLTTYTSRLYRYPLRSIFDYVLTAVTIGLAEGALQVFLYQMRDRRGTHDGARAAEDPFVRQRAAQADAVVRGLWPRMQANFVEIDAAIDRDGVVPAEVIVRNTGEAAFIARSSTEAVELLFKATGGRGARLENPMQRYFRDIHTASNHAYLNADKGATDAGAILLGGGS